MIANISQVIGPTQPIIVVPWYVCELGITCTCA